MKIYMTPIWKWTNNKAIFFEGQLIRDESVSTFWHLRRKRRQESKELSTERWCLQPSEWTETMETRGSAVNVITRPRQVQNKHCTSWAKLQNEKLDHTTTAAWVRKTAESGVDYKSFRKSLVFSRFKISYALKHFLKSFWRVFIFKNKIYLFHPFNEKSSVSFFLFCTCITSHRLKLELWLLESFLFLYIYISIKLMKVTVFTSTPDGCHSRRRGDSHVFETWCSTSHHIFCLWETKLSPAWFIERAVFRSCCHFFLLMQ